MTIYISATTRPAWSQQRQGSITAKNRDSLETHLRKIAEADLARTRTEEFSVLAIDEALNRIQIHVQRSALFTVEYRTAQDTRS